MIYVIIYGKYIFAEVSLPGLASFNLLEMIANDNCSPNIGSITEIIIYLLNITLILSSLKILLRHGIKGEIISNYRSTLI